MTLRAHQNLLLAGLPALSIILEISRAKAMFFAFMDLNSEVENIFCNPPASWRGNISASQALAGQLLSAPL